MTISTIRSKSGKLERGGFTLVEVLISTSIGAIVLAGVMSTFLMLGRSGANIANYSTMESQSRRALEEFSQDLRMANAVTWNSSSSITLTIPNNYTPTLGVVTYSYDSASETFNRSPRDSSSAAGTSTVLINNIVTFAYSRYDRINNVSTLDTTTKRIQLSMTASTAVTSSTASGNTRKSRTVPGATNIILSASYILRNKYAN